MDRLLGTRPALLTAYLEEIDSGGSVANGHVEGQRGVEEGIAAGQDGREEAPAARVEALHISLEAVTRHLCQEGSMTV